MMKFVVLASTIFSAAYGFAPSSISVRRTASRVGMSEEEPVVLAQEGEETATTTTPVAETFATVGSGSLAWNPDASKPCYGLPGAIAPLGFFDPLGFSKDKELGGVKRLREAEVMHCRVAMMAVVGYLIGESTPTITYGFTIPHTIANDQIPEVPGTVLFPFFLLINICEAYRANRGWVEPGLGPLFSLREGYYPGDLGFDPLGLKPSDPMAFERMQAKELSNGRLAMIAAAGFCVQELVNGKGILENLGVF